MDAADEAGRRQIDQRRPAEHRCLRLEPPGERLVERDEIGRRTRFPTSNAQLSNPESPVFGSWQLEVGNSRDSYFRLITTFFNPSASACRSSVSGTSFVRRM